MSKDKKPSIKALQGAHNQDKNYQEILGRFKLCTSFSLGDYLIKKECEELGVFSVEKTMGTPVRYKVVHLTEANIAHIMKVSTVTGLTIGDSISTLDGHDSDTEADAACGMDLDVIYSDYFELDPEYVDHLLLNQGEPYEPYGDYKNKVQLRNSIVAHNKAAKINCNVNSFHSFFKTLTVGDKVWHSSSNYSVVEKIEVYSNKDYVIKRPTLGSRIAKASEWMVVTLIAKSGRKCTIDTRVRPTKALYRIQPRSYKELKI